MKQKKAKVDRKQIIDFIRTPKGKAVLFFSFYLVFFLVVAIIARISTGNPLGSTNYQSNSTNYHLSSIQNRNYQFSYQYMVDDVSTIYMGSRKNLKASFSDGVTSYYQNGNLTMKLQDGIWIKCDSPYLVSYLLDDVGIENVLQKATYVSKTELATGEVTLQYQITTTTLVQLIDGIDVDLDDVVNTIEIRENKNREITEINYDISSYAKYRGLCFNQFLLNLSYSHFDEIEAIEDPT